MSQVKLHKKWKQTHRHRLMIAMEGWGRGGVGVRLYVYMSHRDTQHCKSTIFQSNFLHFIFSIWGEYNIEWFI